MNVALKGEVVNSADWPKGSRVIVSVAEDGSSLLEVFNPEGELIAVAAPFLLTPDIFEGFQSCG